MRVAQHTSSNHARHRAVAEPDDTWICTWCEHGGHASCFGSAVCECPCADPARPWIPPDRRTELRQLASSGQPQPYLPAHERDYITGLQEHWAARRASEDRRA